MAKLHFKKSEIKYFLSEILFRIWFFGLKLVFFKWFISSLGFFELYTKYQVFLKQKNSTLDGIFDEYFGEKMLIFRGFWKNLKNY